MVSEQLPLWADPAPDPTERPKVLLRNSNADLRRDGIYVWTLPALAVRLPDGRSVKTCPAAGVCAQVCYARFGTYTWRTVKAAHLRNLLFVLEDPEGWERAMLAELARAKFTGKYVRLHDAGDFFSDDYTEAWLRIIRARPGTQFYCYTKEVRRFRRMVEPDRPANLRWAYSLGGREDHLLDTDSDRIADVFPTAQGITDAGWHPQTESDLLAVLGPKPVGMAANNIPQAKKRQGDRTLGEWQRAEDARRRR